MLCIALLAQLRQAMRITQKCLESVKKMSHLLTEELNGWMLLTDWMASIFFKRQKLHSYQTAANTLPNFANTYFIPRMSLFRFCNHIPTVFCLQFCFLFKENMMSTKNSFTSPSRLPSPRNSTSLVTIWNFNMCHSVRFLL